MKQNRQLREYFENQGLYVPSQSDRSRLVKVLTDSFFDYPLFEFFFEKNDRAATELFMEVTIDALGKNSIVVADSPDINSVMIFYGSNMGLPGAFEIVVNGGYKFIKAYGMKTVSRMLRYLLYIDRIMSKIKKKSDSYIYFLATELNMRRKGIAKRLLEAAKVYSQDNNCGIYLETNKKENSEIYQSVGFDLKDNFLVENGNGMEYFALTY